MPLAAIYARYSSDKQRDESIEIQVDYCKELISHYPEWTLTTIYADKGKSGRSDNRPQFRQCMKDAKAKKFDVLVVYKFDRFARSVEVSRKYKRQLQRVGIELYSVREGKSSDSPEAYLSEVMQEAVAEYYSLNLAKLVKDGMSKSAQKRKACGRRIYGYTTNAQDDYVADTERAPIVQRIFMQYNMGKSLQSICDGLNKQGITTSTGARWNKQTVSRLLRNDAYVGVYRFNGIVDRTNGIPPIVDYELFSAVQNRLNSVHKGRTTTQGGNFLLTGKLYCAYDMRPLHGVSGTSKTGTKYAYYKCGAKGGCKKAYPQVKLERTVVDAVRECLSEPAIVDTLVGWVMEYEKTRPSPLEELRTQAADVERQMDNIHNAIRQGATYEEFSKDLTELKEQFQRLNMQIALENHKRDDWITEDKVRDMVREVLRYNNDTPEDCRAIVSTFVDRVYVSKEFVLLTFAVGEYKEFEYSEEWLNEVTNTTANPQVNDGVRVSLKWWTMRDAMLKVFECAGIMGVLSTSP